MRVRDFLAILLLALVLATAGVATLPRPVTADTSLTAHAPIVINGDSGFSAANGVVSGGGTSADPYVIAGWSITMSTSSGITVSNTRRPFVIRDTSVAYTTVISYGYVGIGLTNVTDAFLANLTLTTQATALSVTASSNVTLVQSTVNSWQPQVLFDHTALANVSYNYFTQPAYTTRTPEQSIALWSSDDAVIQGNTFALPGESVYMTGSRRATIVGNLLGDGGLEIIGASASDYASHTIEGNYLAGGRPLVYEKNVSNVTVGGSRVGALILANCTNVVASNLSLTGTAVGLTLAFVHHATLSRVNASSDYEYGLLAVSVSNVSVESSLFSENLEGASLRNSENVTLRGDGFVLNSNMGVQLLSSTNVWAYHNNFGRNEYDVGNLSSASVHFDVGYPLGGNHWFNYNGTDRCNGPVQDNCTAGDGIGDTPYVFGTDVDRFPLMASNASADTPPSVNLVLMGQGWSSRGDHSDFQWSFNPMADAFDAEDPVWDLSYRWDYQGDGSWDTNWTQGLYTGNFLTNVSGNYAFTVEVRDTSGLTAEARLPYTVPALPDFTPPTLSFAPPASYPVGFPIPVWAYASDPSGIRNVTLQYRIGNGSLVSVPMASEGNGSYLALIPAQASATTVEARVEAYDIWSNEALSPSTGGYITIQVQATTPPAFGFSAPDLIAVAAVCLIVLWEVWSRVLRRKPARSAERPPERSADVPKEGRDRGRPPSG